MSFKNRLFKLKGKIEQSSPAQQIRKNWHWHYDDDDEPTEFFLKIFRKLAGAQKNIDCWKDQEVDNEGLIFIGHGDEKGAYNPAYFNIGIKKYICDYAEINSCSYSPQIWWACKSANWLINTKRKDWFGYEKLIGCDTRGKGAKWWYSHVKKLIGCLLDVCNNKENINKFNKIAKRGYNNAIKKSLTRRRHSHLTLIFAKAFTLAKWEKDFRG